MLVCLVTMQGISPAWLRSLSQPPGPLKGERGGGTSLTSTTSFLLNLRALGVIGLAITLDEELTVAKEFIGSSLQGGAGGR